MLPPFRLRIALASLKSRVASPFELQTAKEATTAWTSKTIAKMEEVWEKSQTVDPEVRAYVYSLCSAVGGSSTYDDTYAVGDDALAALNDILRWLRLVGWQISRVLMDHAKWW